MLILLTSSDSARLLEINQYLKCHFVTKDMGCPKYFLGIEVAHQKHIILLSQRKYALDLLEEARLLGCKPTTLQWKPMWIYGLMTVIHLMTQEDIGDKLRS